MRSALHIEGRQLQALTLEGDALKITLQGRSPVWFPLRRLRRITLAGEIQVGLPALCECARQHIPVVFLDGRGRVSCTLLRPVHHVEPLGEVFSMIADDPELQEAYLEWWDNQQRHWFRQLGARPVEPRRQREELRRAVRQALQAQGGQARFAEVKPWLEGFTQSHVTGILTEMGIDLLHGQSEACIAQFTELLMPAVELAWAGQQSAAGQLSGSRAALQCYQAIADDLEFELRRMLNQLIWHCDRRYYYGQHC